VITGDIAMTTKFQKGKSGNPKGKPPGAKDKRTEMRELLKPHATELINKVVSMAIAGDTTALRICLDRIIPPVKAVAEPVNVTLPKGSNLADQGTAIFQAAASGKISTDEASSLMSILAGQVRIVEATNLDERIKALEEQLLKKGGTL
jgi:hypothetical protein